MQIRSERSLFQTLILLVFLTACSESSTPIPGIGPIDGIQRVATDFGFTEGPAVDSEGGIYFSDLESEKIFHRSITGDLTTFVEASARANGLMVDEERNRLLACESGSGAQKGVSRIVAFDLDTGDLSVVADGYQGKPFNRVNDLVVDSEGGIYFSDILGGEPGLPQKNAGVYHVATDGVVSLLIDDLSRPNGVLLSPDEMTLYVLPFGTPDLMAYPVTSPGVVGSGRVLSALPAGNGANKKGGDGMAVDSEGNLYIAMPMQSSIVVISSAGVLIGTIELPERPANAVFAGQNLQTLYVTSRKSLYALKMEVTGHAFGRRRDRP